MSNAPNFMQTEPLNILRSLFAMLQTWFFTFQKNANYLLAWYRKPHQRMTCVLCFHLLEPLKKSQS